MATKQKFEADGTPHYAYVTGGPCPFCEVPWKDAAELELVCGYKERTTYGGIWFGIAHAKCLFDHVDGEAT